MNKTELIAAVVEKTQMSKKNAEQVVNAVFGAVTEAVAKGEKVQIVGFGTFELRERGERIGRNPRTGEEMTIAASKQPVFKAGKAFKDMASK